MLVNGINFHNYRNLKDNSLTFSNKINVIYGNNAQGKTNLLESLWLFTGNKSFRSSKDKDFINFEKKDAKIYIKFSSNKRNQTSELIFSDKKFLKINGVNKNKMSDLGEVFSAVIFSPMHLSLIKGGPNERRKFLDIAIYSNKNIYSNLVKKYNHILNQRNTLLKEIQNNKKLIDTLDIWDESLSDLGSKIINERLKYIKELSNKSIIIYNDISQNKEKIKIKYNSFFNENENNCGKQIKNILLKKLHKDRNNDLKFGFTNSGPHRDDLEFYINDKLARKFASQGQQRSFVLSLKLAESLILEETKKEKPVILLDDVMSELDDFRKNYILNNIIDRQVFITCCDLSFLKKSNNLNKFYIENGVVKN